MSGVKINTQITKTTSCVVEIGRKEILEILRRNYHEIPDNALIYIMVPGGGDWSNTRLDIGVDVDLKVAWTTTEDSST